MDRQFGEASGHVRIAHLLCELLLRMRAVELTEGDSCALPLTQEEIGDATGLSNVHVNRSLQELRAEGLIEIGRGALRILDWIRMKEAAGFDLTYLHHRSAA